MLPTLCILHSERTLRRIELLLESDLPAIAGCWLPTLTLIRLTTETDLGMSSVTYMLEYP
jgi:hypothetical protein